MNQNYIKYLIITSIFPIFTAFQCSGNLFLGSGYEYDVIVSTIYNYNNASIELKNLFYPGMVFAVDAKGHNKYSNIVAIKIENQNGIMLANYTSEYLEFLRIIYKQKKNKQESWIFTEKGLFLETDKIGRKYNWNIDGILTYYRSDEAVNDLKSLIEANNNVKNDVK